MRRYIIALVIMAILVGSLFRATAQTGVRLMNMFATIGIFLFGVVGSLALTRWQSNAGVKEVQGALKSLEPDWLITDWAFRGGGRPDYLLVGPGGLVAVCLDETPQSTWPFRPHRRLARSRERTEAAVRWLRDQLSGAAPEGGVELPVAAVMVMTRRRAEPDAPLGGVTVLNTEHLADHIRTLSSQELLDDRARVQLTRTFRSA